MTEKRPIRCAIYTRKSTEHGLELEFNSLDAQREACEAYIKSQAHEGWNALPRVMTTRPIPAAISTALPCKNCSRISMPAQSKWWSSTKSTGSPARSPTSPSWSTLRRQNVSFVAVTQQFNTTTSMGRLTLNVLLSFAQFERELSSERVRDKVAASRKKGKWTGGGVPLGYEHQGQEARRQRVEAETVRLIFRRYLALKCLRRFKVELERERNCVEAES